jgi:hypothetical protein
MATHYYCSTCELTFPLDELHEETYYVTSEFSGARMTQARTCLVCPECGDDVEETTAPSAEEDDEACCANEERDSTSNCINCGYPYSEA